MMECFIFRGFSRADHSINVSLIVDVDSSDIMRNDVRARVTEKIAGPGYCFPTSQTVIRPVPDVAKNKLFMSDAELYAAAPELDYRKRKRRTKTEKADAFAAQLQQWGGKPAASIVLPAPKSSSVATGVSYIFRGFDYTGDDERGYTISKDGVELAGPLPTKAAVMAWVDEAKRLEMTKAREAKPASSIEPPALKPRKPPRTPPQPVQSAPAVKPRELPLKPDAAITLLEYGTLDDAFKYLNAKLFDGALPDLLIVFSRCASRGHYAAGRWSGRANDFGTDELRSTPTRSSKGPTSKSSARCYMRWFIIGRQNSETRRSAPTTTGSGLEKSSPRPDAEHDRRSRRKGNGAELLALHHSWRRISAGLQGARGHRMEA